MIFLAEPIRTMSTTADNATLDYQVADIGLAEFGRKEIRLAENDLYAVRADATTESVLQRYMSEGTSDQIYLALRLAALVGASFGGI